MKMPLATLIAAVVVTGFASTATADATKGHIVGPQEIRWGLGPAVLPPGAEAAVL